jgi:hypothetical protein
VAKTTDIGCAHPGLHAFKIASSRTLFELAGKTFMEGGKTTALRPGRSGSIQPSVEASGKEPGDKILNCVIANARRVARLVRESEPVLKESVEKHGVKVVAAD